MRVLLPVGAALLGGLLYHRYSLLTGLDRVQADPGDSRFIAFVLEHWRNVFLGQARWDSPPIFWPAQGTLAYSDTLVGMGVIHAALRSFLDVFAAMNVQEMLLSLASFAGAYALMARGFGLGVWGATAGAYFFAYSWPRFAQLVHVQLQFTPLLPVLTLLALECLRDGAGMARWRFGVRAGLFVALLAVLLATTLYYAIFLALGLLIALAVCAASAPGRRQIGAVIGRHRWVLLAAAALAAGLIGPIVAFYVPVMRESQGRPWSEVLPGLPTPMEFLWTGRENLVWGWLFGRWPVPIIDARWPEDRIGVGAVVSLAWAAGVAWAAWTVAGPGRRDRRMGPIAVVILTGFLLQVLMLRLPGHGSAWWLVWWSFPGASGVRAVARLEIVVTLAMALWLGVLVDGAIRRAGRRPMLRAGVALLAGLAAVEQLGGTHSYSGGGAAALSGRIAAAIPDSCRASYVVATPDLIDQGAEVDEAQFDPQAYLAANPDVAASWGGTPWDHYRLFGRAEHRLLDPARARLHVLLNYFAYNYSVPLAAVMTHRPVVNGVSGWQPPGWTLFDVLSPSAPARLEEWVAQNRLPPDAVCVVPVRMTLETVYQIPPFFWP